MIKTYIITGILLLLTALHTSAQVTDSLSLNEIIQKTITSHPSVMMAEQLLNSADIRISQAKTGYYPEVDVSANYSNIGPVTKLTIPEMGSFQLFPANNYSAGVNYRQTIYDFGRTRQNIRVETESKNLDEQSLEQTRQKLALLAVNNYFTMLFLQSAIRIKDEQMQALNEHLDYITKKYQTGSATEYQLLSTRVRISTVESQKVDLESSLYIQQAILKSLTGEENTSSITVKNEIPEEIPVLPSDSLLPFALKNRNEANITREKSVIAELRYKLISLQNKPMLSVFASGGAKNGYVPYLNEIKANYIAGLGLRIPIFDANRNKHNLSQARVSITSLGYELENTKRTIANEIAEAQSYMTAAETKVTQFRLQLEQAEKAYELAITSFNSGTITNLDLLDSNTAVSESRLMLLKARIDYAASIYKFRAALGERVY